jgi:choline dehydrogenase-like flavoprotein
VKRSSAEPYDAVVVGSGACGGWAAKELTEGGLRVALLEAGPLFPSTGDGLAPAPLPAERQPVQSQSYALTEATSRFFVDDIDNPYAHPADKPFSWIRGRQVGGRLHTWQRACPRLSDLEFKAASRDGVGEDWPISHSDLAPYYDRVERFLGVYGATEGLAQMPDGRFLEPPELTAGERRIKSAVERRWSTRRATSLRIARNSPDATLVAAMRTGRLTLVPDSIARLVRMDAGTGRAAGVSVVDRLTGEEREVDGRVVVLCASAIESTRLLLNSATPEHPNGLGNSSGVLGHYLMDHSVGIGIDGFASPRVSGTGNEASCGLLIPGFRNVTEHDVDFLRSYELVLAVRPPPSARPAGIRNRFRPRRGHFWIRTFGEVLPSFDNHVSLHPEKRDAWGIPIAQIVCGYGENERKMAADIRQRMLEIVEAASGFRIAEAFEDFAPPGTSAHELGTARMGSSPETSVLNPHNQSWDVENLFVTDGACFTSAGYQNPALTMMAITARACEHIIGRLKRREL